MIRPKPTKLLNRQSARLLLRNLSTCRRRAQTNGFHLNRLHRYLHETQKIRLCILLQKLVTRPMLQQALIVLRQHA